MILGSLGAILGPLAALLAPLVGGLGGYVAAMQFQTKSGIHLKPILRNKNDPKGNPNAAQNDPKSNAEITTEKN